MSELGGEVYRLLKSPVRREIIALLYTRGEMNATQLRLLLDISYGTLYYHLDFLKPLIAQVGRGRYRLNPRGMRVAERMLEEMARASDESGDSWGKPGALGALTLTALVERATASPPHYIPAALVAAALYVSLTFYMPVKPIILHLIFSEEPSGVVLPLVSLVLTVGYFLLAGGVLSRRGGVGGLLTSVLLSYIPVDVYLGVLMLLSRVGMLLEELTPIFQAGFVAAHVVQLVMLAGALTHSRGVGWERSLPAALLLSYLSLLVSYYGIL